METLKLTKGKLITDDDVIEKRIVIETDVDRDEVCFYLLNIGIVQMSFSSLSNILSEALMRRYEG